MQPKFGVDEKVLCYHGPLLYEAKVLRSRKEGSTYSYFVHYQGWNRNWDEWVGETRMLKQVQENFEKQKKLLAAHVVQTKANKKAKKEAAKKGKGGSDSGSNSRASTPTIPDRGAGRPPKRSLADDERSTSSRDGEETVSNPSSTPSSARGATQGQGHTKKKKESESSSTTAPQETDQHLFDSILSDNEPPSKYNIELPQDLKTIIVNDWDLVVHQKYLFKVPAKVTVSHIIDQYVTHLASLELPPVKRSVASEVIKGLGEYFNVSVGPQLLYQVEKLQYSEDCESAGAVQPVDIYGAAHLLRLMVKVGGYLSCSNYSEQNVRVLEEHIDDFLSYLDMNRSMFFNINNYAPASPEYLLKSGLK